MTRACRKWTEEEIKKLEELYSNKPAHIIAEELGRTVESITTRASLLGLTNDLRRKPIWEVVPDPSNLKAIAWTIATEGTIGIRLQKNRKGHVTHDPYVEVGNTSLILLEKFMEMVGAGRIYKHPPVEGRKTFYHWVLNRTIETLRFLELIKPFLPIKEKQAEYVIELCKLGLNTPLGKKSPYKEREKELYLLVKKFNRGGDH